MSMSKASVLRLTSSKYRALFTVGPPGFAYTATAELPSKLNRQRMHALLCSAHKPVAWSLLRHQKIFSCGKEDKRTLIGRYTPYFQNSLDIILTDTKQ